MNLSAPCVMPSSPVRSRMTKQERIACSACISSSVSFDSAIACARRANIYAVALAESISNCNKRRYRRLPPASCSHWVWMCAVNHDCLQNCQGLFGCFQAEKALSGLWVAKWPAALLAQHTSQQKWLWGRISPLRWFGVRCLVAPNHTPQMSNHTLSNIEL
jgi:hypothetical protein